MVVESVLPCEIIPDHCLVFGGKTYFARVKALALCSFSRVRHKGIIKYGFNLLQDGCLILLKSYQEFTNIHMTQSENASQRSRALVIIW